MQYTKENLTELMASDHVIRANEDLSIDDFLSVYAPELQDGELYNDQWSLMNGYSGRYGYSGPIMHESEFIGGGMAEDILSTPGYYVSLISYCEGYTDCHCDPEVGCDHDTDGWAVAYRSLESLAE